MNRKQIDLTRNTRRTSLVRFRAMVAFCIAILVGTKSYAVSGTVCENNTAVANFGMDAEMYANLTFANSDDWFKGATPSGTGIGIIGTTAATARGPLAISAAAFKTLLQNATSITQRNVTYQQRMSVPFETMVAVSGGSVSMLDAVAGRDNIATAPAVDSSVFSGNGNKNGDNPTSWSVGVGNVPSKNDIVDVGGHLRRSFDASMNPGDLWGFTYATTLSTNGDSHVDFEYYRTSPSFNAIGGVVSNTGPAATGGHTAYTFNSNGSISGPGDVLLSIDYNNGGTNPVASVRVWVKPTALATGITSFAAFNALANKPFTFTGVFDGGTNTNGYGYAEIQANVNSGCLIYAKTNKLAPCRIGGTPWGNLFTSGATYQDSIECLQLVETGIDFTRFGLDAVASSGPCFNLFGSIMVKTRSSQSFTASLKDYAGPYAFGNFAEVVANAGVDKVLTCSVTSLQLSGSTTTPGATYSWSTTNGNIVSGGNTLTPTINAAGTYILRVTNPLLATCSATDTAIVTANTTPPSGSCTAGAEITCSRTSSTISVSATASAGNTITGYAWNPGGSTGTSITVSDGNAYTVTITQSNGCTLSSTCNVNVNTCTPNVTANNAGPISCANPSRSVSTNATACGSNTITGYAWSGSAPSITALASSAAFSASAPDSYTVTVTQSNGCTASASTTLTTDLTPPVAVAGPDQIINCLTPNGEVTLGDAAVSGFTYSWTPGSQTTSTITVNAAGTYCVTATKTSNGCTASDCADVVLDITPPVADAGPDKIINCNTPGGQVSLGTPDNSAFSYSWAPNNQTTAEITSNGAGTYCVTVTKNSNGCTASDCASVTTDLTPPPADAGPDQVINCNTPGGTVSLGSAATAGLTYSWTPGSQSTATINVSNAGTYCVTVTKTSNGCTASDCATVTNDLTAPSCSIPGPALVVCSSTGNTITATVTNAQSGATYAWTVESGNGYVITSGNTATVTYTAGSNSGSLRLTVTNPNGCSSSCVVTVNCACGRYCTYTQGYYGNAGGSNCLNNSTSAFVSTLIGSTPLMIGAGSNSITFTSADVSCLISRMPSGGSAATLNGIATCSTPTGISINNGKFYNVLLGQTITLGLNLRINGGILANVPMNGRYLTTYAVNGTGCGNTGTVVSGSAQVFSIPANVLTYLGATNTIGDLYSLANRALGRTYNATGQNPSLTDISNAVDVINRAFDGCRMLGGFSNTTAAPRLMDAAANQYSDQLLANGIVAKAYPNPFTYTTTIEFALNDYTESVSVEVFTLSGRKVATLFNRAANGGELNRVEFNAAELANGIYVYRIATKDKVHYDKLLLNR